VSDRNRFHDVGVFCIFIGYPRSGHSLVGSLLNAHPEVIISHELDVLRCAAIVYDKPNRSRSRVDWTDDGIARVDDAIERFSFLAGFSYGGR
jgi:phage terminase large subunit-like protein